MADPAAVPSGYGTLPPSQQAQIAQGVTNSVGNLGTADLGGGINANTAVVTVKNPDGSGFGVGVHTGPAGAQQVTSVSVNPDHSSTQISTTFDHGLQTTTTTHYDGNGNVVSQTSEPPVKAPWYEDTKTGTEIGPINPPKGPPAEPPKPSPPKPKPKEPDAKEPEPKPDDDPKGEEDDQHDSGEECKDCGKKADPKPAPTALQKLGAFAKGFAVGAATAALMVGIGLGLAAVSPVLGTAFGVAAGVVGVAGLIGLGLSWGGLSSLQRYEAIGGIVGGVVGGLAAVRGIPAAVAAIRGPKPPLAEPLPSGQTNPSGGSPEPPASTQQPPPGTSGSGGSGGSGGAGGSSTKPPLGLPRPPPRLPIGNNKLGLAHIIKRHWWNTAATNVGKFAKGLSVSNLKSLINRAVLEAAKIRVDQGKLVFEFDFGPGNVIGVNQAGALSTTIRVVLTPDNVVITAYPI